MRRAAVGAIALAGLALVAAACTAAGAADGGSNGASCETPSFDGVSSFSIQCTIPQATTTVAGPTSTVTAPGPTVTVTASPSVTPTETPTPTPTPTPTTVPAGSYPQPGTVGYLGDALPVYSAANGKTPAGCAWNQTYKYLRCDGTDLTLDRVEVDGGIYWTGCGTLTITHSVMQMAPSTAWFDVYAQCSKTKSISVTDSTMQATANDAACAKTPLDPCYQGGSDVAGVWANSPAPLTIQRDLFTGFPQGPDPTSGSVITDNEIRTLDAKCPAGPCHVDGVFSQGGNGITIARNYIQVPKAGTATAAVFFQDIPCTPMTGIVVDSNYLAGGAYTLRNECAAGLTVTNNTFAGGVYGDAFNSGSIAVWSGNKTTAGAAVVKP